jgi:DnaK suppressor protein
MAEPAADGTIAALLATRRTAALETLRAAGRDYDRIVEAGQSVATDDEHDPEGAGLAIERARIIAVLEHARTDLKELDEAEARLTSGAYGVCAGCSQPIAPARLEALPTTTTCIACAGSPRLRAR